jgi:hypothetical protein
MPQPLHSDSLDIEGHRVIDSRSEGGELMVYVTWCHRWPCAWLYHGSRVLPVDYAYGPPVTTEIHVWGDYPTVCSAPVPRTVESVLVAYVAGLFAADAEVAA